MAKKKINDDKLLQLIRDGNSPAELERRISALEDLGKRSGVRGEGQDQWPLTSNPLPGEACSC
ncbi:MAG: hypothetical protein WAN11_06830 [Syntrophobacteraceae bacterium]